MSHNHTVLDPHALVMTSSFDEETCRFVNQYTHVHSGRTFDSKNDALTYVETLTGRDRDSIQTHIKSPNWRSVESSLYPHRTVKISVWAGDTWEDTWIEVLEDAYPELDEETVLKRWDELSYVRSLGRTSSAPIFGGKEGDEKILYGKLRDWTLQDGENVLTPFVFVELAGDSARIGVSFGTGWFAETFAIVNRSDLCVAAGVAVSLAVHFNNVDELETAEKRWRNEVLGWTIPELDT